ncbi:MAG: protein kinase [Eubacteriales bacterium]
MLERSAIEGILKELDGKGHIFPDYAIKREEGNLQKLSLLGRGSFSSVYEMILKENPEKKYALKVIGFEKYTVSHERFFETMRLQTILSQETAYVAKVFAVKEILVMFHEEGVIAQLKEVGENTKDSILEEDGLCIQFILMEQLEDVIQQGKRQQVTLKDASLYLEKNVIRFAMEVGDAIHNAHSNHILHRDIKLENIFWDITSKTYKLGDFGIAKFLEGENAETIMYTNGYGAPEVESGQRYNETADIYSFGITLYLLLNDLVFPGAHGYYPNMIQYHPEFIFPAPCNGSEQITRIIRKMCCYHREERYQTMAEVLLQLSSIDKKEEQVELFELEEMATETYKSSEVFIRNHEKEGNVDNRIERKKKERIYREIEMIDYWKYFIGLTIAFLFMMVGKEEVFYLYQWNFLVLASLVFIEGILLRLKELHLLFGSVVLGGILFSMYSVGVTVPHMVLLLGIGTQLPTVAFSAGITIALYVGLAGYIEQYLNTAILNRVNTYGGFVIMAVVVFGLIQGILQTKRDFGEEMQKGEYLKFILCGRILPFLVLVGCLIGEKS